MENNCKNCGDLITKNYCGNCGNSNKINRIDKNYAIQEFLSLLNFDNGLLYTIKGLLLNPSFIFNEFLNNNRNKITKPITFLGITSVIYTLIANYLKVEMPYDEMSKEMYGNSSMINILTWIQENYGYANLLMILPITFCTLLFFRKHKYNFYEIFAVICFVAGMGMLIFALEPILNKLSINTFFINETVIFIIALIYMSWAIGQLFGNNLKDYFKGLLAYISGFIIFGILVILSAVIYDTIIR